MSAQFKRLSTIHFIDVDDVEDINVVKMCFQLCLEYDENPNIYMSQRFTFDDGNEYSFEPSTRLLWLDGEEHSLFNFDNPEMPEFFSKINSQ